ncbi:MAG: twin-arginine translocation pathway signal protein, partial [Paracoccaceae bacterium]
MTKISRRNFMHIVGGGTIVAATTPLAACDVADSGIQPWAQAGQYNDPLRNALSYALLAPNPHNRQPWMVDLAKSGNALTLYVDTDRLLPDTDPFNRQITVGLGCFLELMVMAAQAQGYSVALTLFPDGFDNGALDLRPVAYATFTKADTAPSPLFKHVLARRSNKDPFDDTKPVTTDALTTITQAAHADIQTGQTNDEKLVSHLRELTWQAFKIEYETPRTLAESIHLMRMGSKEVSANPDGIAMQGAFLEIMMALGILTKKKMRDPNSTAWQQGLDMYEPITATAMGYVWIKT